MLKDVLKLNAIAQVGGGSGGAKSWNDLTDKPFYTEIGETVLSETTMEYNEDLGGCVSADVISLVVGNTYVVSYNGTEYNCLAASYDLDGTPTVSLGDVDSLDGGVSIGGPFALLSFSAEVAAEAGMGAILIPLDGSTSATVSIKEAIVHPLPVMYMPELVVTFSDDGSGGYTADKTLEQIKDAVDNGYRVTGKQVSHYVNGNAEGIQALFMNIRLINLADGIVKEVCFDGFFGNTFITVSYKTDGVTIARYNLA